MLSVGARIALVAPSGVFDPARLARGIEMAKSWGYKIVPGRYLRDQHRYLAGTQDARAADLQWALCAPDIDAVWFARGGYGTSQLLSKIPWGKLDGRPVIGFSDATALFSALHRKGKGGGIHGPVLHSLADLTDDESQQALRNVLNGRAVGLPVRHLGGPEREVDGLVVGGNLCVLSSLVGTQWQLPTADRIVVLEDVAEEPYKIDRQLLQMVDGGGLWESAGIVFGHFQGCDPPSGADWSLNDVFLECLSHLDIPLYCGLPVGHGSKNMAWRVGAPGTLGPGGLRQIRVD